MKDAETTRERLLSCELTVGKMQADTFSGSGLIVANPPWTFPQTAEILSSRLTTILQQWSGPAWRVDWLSPPL